MMAGPFLSEEEFMERKQIEKMESWLALKQRLIERGYKLWQTQYGWYLPEGYIVGFWKDDRQLEVTTHNREIAEDIKNSDL